MGREEPSIPLNVDPPGNLDRLQLSLVEVLLDFRDSYYVRSRLLDHLSSDGFDYWSDRRVYFPRSFLHWRAFGLGLGDRALRCLGYLASLTAFS